MISSQIIVRHFLIFEVHFLFQGDISEGFITTKPRFPEDADLQLTLNMKEYISITTYNSWKANLP